MNDMKISKNVLFALASRWEQDAIEPEKQDGSPEAERGNLLDRGNREGKRECADGLRTLLNLL